MPGRQELIYPAPPASVGSFDGSWWGTYARHASSGLSPTAWQVLEADCAYIAGQCLLPAGQVSTGQSLRRGLVIGSVQSGKTASMLGLTALALDGGVDAVVVLAGTQRSLWQQTFDRLVRQLETGEDGPRADRHRLIPPVAFADSDVWAPPAALYALPGPVARLLLKNQRPLLALVMKHPDHLRAFGKMLSQRIYPELDNGGRPFHIIVLDDEADDGSVLDAEAERGEDPVFGQLKQIPRLIADIWDPQQSGRLANSLLRVTYVAYTATPPANLLQADYNPLFPQDFVASLRTPSDKGDLLPRASTFREPLGLSRYYCGGDVFYRRGRTASLAVPDSPSRDALGSAVKAFLVAGAIRLLRQTGRLGPLSARTTKFRSAGEAVGAVASPHSMLIHPSSRMIDHFDLAAELLVWAGLDNEAAAQRALREPEPRLPGALLHNLATDEKSWLDWLVKYRLSAASLQEEYNLPAASLFSEWELVKDALATEIIPGTRVSVINSDPDSDLRPQFFPKANSDGSWSAPRNLCTIFISGDVMSRGLTLEGLTTTLFHRRADQPAADTQMQMQRWFGYRGDYLELCRVFAPADQLDLFARYHDNDEALRAEVIDLMNRGGGSSTGPQILQGRGFRATSKIASVRNEPLGVGALPFIRHVNARTAPDPNVDLLAQLFQSPSSEVSAHGLVRGRVLDAPMDMASTAQMLESLRYADYEPSTGGPRAQRWESISREIGLEPEDPLYPLYRPPSQASFESEQVDVCPFNIAAYMRLWCACLQRHAPGLVGTDDPYTPWSMLNLSRKRSEQPRFWIGWRFGSGGQSDLPGLAALPFHYSTMRREFQANTLTSAWGSRNPGSDADSYRGDALFDFHHHPPRTSVPISDGWRPPGEDGLVLFHLVEELYSPFPVVALGLAMPLGGPDQFAAAVSSTFTAGRSS